MSHSYGHRFIFKEVCANVMYESKKCKIFYSSPNVPPVFMFRVFASLSNSLDSDAGRDWGQEEKGMTENEMAGWHH